MIAYDTALDALQVRDEKTDFPDHFLVVEGVNRPSFIMP